VIDKFIGEYKFLNNFSDHGILYKGKFYKTNEHFYQAHKTTKDEHEKIRLAKTPYEAARLGRTCKMKKRWEVIKIPIMRLGLQLKFAQNLNIQDLLLSTGDEILIEGNKHGDIFWGVCNGRGQNMLGQLLMEVRSELKLKKLAIQDGVFSIRNFAKMMQEGGAVVNGMNPVEWIEKREPIPSHGTLFTLQEFKNDMEAGYIIDNDGSGFYADEKGMTQIPVRCTDLLSEFAHVVWFGR